MSKKSEHENETKIKTKEEDISLEDDSETLTKDVQELSNNSSSVQGDSNISNSNISDRHSAVQNESSSSRTGEVTPETRTSLPKNVSWIRQSKTGNVAPNSLTRASTKMKSLKEWGVKTFKCTKQVVAERMGKASKTVDPQLEHDIEVLRESQRQYSQLLRITEALKNHFYCVVQTQKLLGESFSELSAVTPDLQEEFTKGSQMQTTLVKKGEALLDSLSLFTSTLNTLCNMTMDDTLLTYKHYEMARLEYDAHPRSDVDEIILSNPADSETLQKVETAKKKFQEHKHKYERLKADVAIKLELLQDNKLQVLRSQLQMFQKAISAYYNFDNRNTSPMTTATAIDANENAY